MSGLWPVHTTIALSGLTALGAEVIWTRVLASLFGASVYTFSIILAVFLLGFGIGSRVGSYVVRHVGPERHWDYAKSCWSSASHGPPT